MKTSGDSKKSFSSQKSFGTSRTWAITLGFLTLLLTFSSQVWAANQQYGVIVDYSPVTYLINDPKITLIMNVGACDSVSVTVTNISTTAAVPSNMVNYTANNASVTFTIPTNLIPRSTPGNINTNFAPVTATVTANNCPSRGTGVATKANLYANHQWAISTTFGDGDQGVWDYAVTLMDTFVSADGTTWRGDSSAIGAAVNGVGATETGCGSFAAATAGPGAWNMSWSELQTLQSKGWGIYNETWDHLCDLSCSNVVTQDGNNQNGVTLNGTFYPGFTTEFPGYHVTSQIYPYGVYSSVMSGCSAYPPSYILSGQIVGSTAGQFNNVAPPWPSASQALTVQMNADDDYPTTTAEANSYADMAAAAGVTTPVWTVDVYHQVQSASSAQAEYEVLISSLHDHWTYLQNTYGNPANGGNNSMWFAPFVEVMDYLMTRNTVSVSTFTPGTPTFTATGTLPTNTFTPTNTLSPTSTPTPCGIVIYNGTAPHALANVASQALESTVSETTGAAYTAGGDTNGLNWALSVPVTTYYANLSINWSNYSNTNTVNLANYTTVQFFINNTTAANSPMTFSVYLDDYQGPGTYPANLTQSVPATVVVTGTGWQAVNIPASSFMSGNASYSNATIGEIDIDLQAPSAGVTDTVYVDSVGFNSGCGTTSTFTLTATNTSTNTATRTATNTATNTPTNTATTASSNTATNTATATATNTATNTASNTMTATPTNSATNTATVTVTQTSTNTATITDTNTSTNTVTNTATVTLTNTMTNTATITDTYTVTNTATITDTYTVTNTATDTATVTSTNTVTNTATITDTNTVTDTATITDTNTVTNTATDTATITSTNTVTNTATVTDTYTVTPTFTNTGTATNTNTATDTATITDTQTATNTPTMTSTNTFTNTPTNTYTHTYTPTFTATASYTYTFTPTFTYTHTTTPTFTLTLTSTPTMTATYTPTISPKVVINQGFPNPSSGSPISFNVSVPSQTTVTLEVFTTALRKIRSLTTHAYGLQTLQWDLKDRAGIPAANGLYYVRVQVAGAQSSTKIMKILILR